MKNLRTILVACVLALGLASCTEAPTAVTPKGPRFDGGFTVGGGHRTSADSITIDGGAERGGFTVGGGH